MLFSKYDQTFLETYLNKSRTCNQNTFHDCEWKFDKNY